MSHFSVLVITETDKEDELKKALQPFHEYECTGVEDEYVIWVDKHDEALELYAKETTRKWKDENGNLFCPYDNRFYREPTAEEKKHVGMGSGFGNGISWNIRDWKDGQGYRAKVHMTAEEANLQEVELPTSKFETIDEWAEGYGGWKRNDSGRFGDITNPNAKWDWWQIGGRYSGKFKPDYDPSTDPKNQKVCWLCYGTGKRSDMEVPNGCNGCQGKGIAAKWPTQWKTDGNKVRVKDIQWEALIQSAVTDELKEYDKAAALTAGMELPEKWDTLRESLGTEPAREKYKAYPAVQALRDWWNESEIIEKLKRPREEIAQEAAKKPITCFAILHNGTWYEKGKMGWWAIVHDEQDEDIWQQKVNELLASLPQDKWITCVDCHI